MSSIECSGQIQLILGPMFSGKSTELLRIMRRFRFAQKKCLIVKYALDNRYSENQFSTHDKQMATASACKELQEIEHLVEDVDCVGIDEGQFFPDLVQFCENAANNGKVVVVSALDGTFQREVFGRVLDLVPKAESVTKLHAVCQCCFKEASFTKRLGSETKVEVIGGAETYIAVCRKCFFSDEKPINKERSAIQNENDSPNVQNLPPTA